MSDTPHDHAEPIGVGIGYPEDWPVCPDGCLDDEDEPRGMDLLVERLIGSTRATLHCADCAFETPAHSHGFLAAALLVRTGRGVLAPTGWTVTRGGRCSICDWAGGEVEPGAWPGHEAGHSVSPRDIPCPNYPMFRRGDALACTADCAATVEA
jgi:hypothetical protein